jgi:hypothetical protein
MLGWKILVHSVQLLVSNLNQALRISGLLYGLQILLSLWLGISVFSGDAALETSVASGDVLWISLLMLITLIANLWIAVA